MRIPGQPQTVCPPATGMDKINLPAWMPGTRRHRQGAGRRCRRISCGHIRYIRGNPPERVKTCGRHRPPQQQAGDTTGFGRQLRPAGQPHPVIRGLADAVIFDNHGVKAFGAQNILKRRQPGTGTGRIDNQQPPRIKPQRRQSGSVQHARSAARRRRTPDNRGRRINPCQNAAKQRHGKTGQRAVMPRPAAQHVHPAERQAASKRRIKRIDAKRQPRGSQLPVKRGNIAAKLAKLLAAHLWL